MQVCFPIYAPTCLELHRKNGEVEIFNFPLPEKADYRDFVIPNGIGYTYEAEEVRRCLMEGIKNDF